jgi:hypothetical protein
MTMPSLLPETIERENGDGEASCALGVGCAPPLHAVRRQQMMVTDVSTNGAAAKYFPERVCEERLIGDE